MKSKVDVIGMAVEIESCHLYLVPGRMASEMEVHMKQRCETEFLHAEKMAPSDTH